MYYYVFRWYMIPYFWVGSKAYDLVAGSAGLQGSYFLSRSKALKIFPMLKSEGLAGAMVYYDGILTILKKRMFNN